MTEGPRGGPAKGTPEYDWLYGSEQPDAADRTRQLPTMPRDADSTRPVRSRGRPTARPTPPAVAPAPSLGKRRPRWRWVLGTVLLAWLVFLVAVPWWAWSRVDKVDAFPAGERPGEQPGTTYLLVGSDSRAGLSAQERKRLGTGGATGQRTDTIMLLHTGSGPNLLLSIPRDSQVEVPGYGRTKVNAAFAYGGPRLLVQTLEDSTGIRIDHYVEIGFGGFVNSVDAVGGIEICPKEAMRDPLANLDIEKGCQEADGVTALGYARSRHTSSLGDIDRGTHQREVFSAVGREVASPWSVLNPVRYVGIWSATSTLRISEGTHPLNLARFGWAMTRVSGDSGMTCTVPIANLAVEWDAERAPQLFQRIIDDETDQVGRNLCSPTGLAR